MGTNDIPFPWFDPGFLLFLTASAIIYGIYKLVVFVIDYFRYRR